MFMPIHKHPKNILLLCGGGGSEHAVSLVSAGYLRQQLVALPSIRVIQIELLADRTWRSLEQDIPGAVQLVGPEAQVTATDGTVQHFPIAAVIPCIHGYPGETGDLQGWFAIQGLPYLGCDAASSRICMNKVTTKLWLEALGIPTVPFVLLADRMANTAPAHALLAQHGSVFVKPASQGSSVGCHPARTPAELDAAIADAFTYGDEILVEQMLTARELELATYQIDGKLHVSAPGEIIVPGGFYSYEEKYATESKTTTATIASNLTAKQITQLKDYARRAFTGLKLRHLSRVDFFLTADGRIYLNEINTFPGMTPISMFPKMMEAAGHRFGDFIASAVSELTT
jgi:D-alanine-D-alanine ligase